METKRNWETRAELASLITYCNDVILPKLSEFENRRLAMKRRRNISIPVYLALFVSVVLIIAKITGRYGFVPHLLFLGCATSVTIFLDGFYEIGKSAKTEIMADIFSHLGWKYTANFEKSTDFYHLNRHGFFPKWHKKYYEDKISGEITGIPFTAFEIHLEHGSGDSEVSHELFMIKAPSAKKFSGMTFMRTKRSKHNLNQRKVIGLKRIKFLSSKFEKLFNVYSTDGIEAQFLLPPDRIEGVTRFTENIEGEKSDDWQATLGNAAEKISQIFMSDALEESRITLESITFMDNHFYLVLGWSDFFEIKRTRIDLSDPIHIDSILAEIEVIFQVFDHFGKWMQASQ